MTRVLRSLAIGLLVLGCTSIGEPSRRSPELVVEASPDLEAVADQVRRIGRRDFSPGLTMTGLIGFSEPIRILLASDESDVAQETPAWVSGFANGEARTIVLFPSRVSSYPDGNLKTLVHHEIAHVLVAEAAHGRAVPRWFNEGVATVAAREWGIEDRARYAAAVVGRGPRTTAELDLGFAQGGRRVARSYALSGAFVRWLQSEYGVQVTARILELISHDMSFREAFVRSTGDTLEWAEHRFFVREAIWHTWVPFVTSSGVLWAGITALAFIAIRRRRLKSAKMRERWELEEEIAEAREDVVPRRSVDFGRTRSLDDVDDDVVN